MVYRVGEVLEPDGPELGKLRITEDFVPMSRAASEVHGQRLQAITDVVMAKVSDLVDVKYRAAGRREGGGAEQFV